MKKENNIILCGIAIAVLASAGFAMSQGTISSADDNYVTPKHVIEEPKEDLELEEDAIEDVEEENDDDWFNIPLPPPNPIESLEEDEIEEEPVKIVNVERPKQPESDFKMIDELLKSTKTYSLEDIVHELKNVVEKFNKKGFHLNLEEKDFENNYQVIINIEKDK